MERKLDVLLVKTTLLQKYASDQNAYVALLSILVAVLAVTFDKIAIFSLIALAFLLALIVIKVAVDKNSKKIETIESELLEIWSPEKTNKAVELNPKLPEQQVQGIVDKLKNWLKKENGHLKKYEVVITLAFTLITLLITSALATVTLYLGYLEFVKAPSIEASPAIEGVPYSPTEVPYVWVRNNGRSTVFMYFTQLLETVCDGKYIQSNGDLVADVNKNPLELKPDEWMPYRTGPGFIGITQDERSKYNECHFHSTIRAIKPNISTELAIPISK